MHTLRSSKLVKVIYWGGAFLALAAIGLSAANKIAAGQGAAPYKTVMGLSIYPIATLVTIGALVAVFLAAIFASIVLKNRDSRALDAEIQRMIETRRGRGGA